MKKFRIILLAIIICCFGYCSQSNIHEAVEFPVTIVAKGETTTDGKYPHGKFIFAVKDDQGRGYDEDVAFHSWNEFNVGDRILIKRCLNENDLSTSRFFFDLFMVLTFVFSIIIYIIFEIGEFCGWE